MNYFNGQHYASLKSICDWLQNIDSNGEYVSVYKQWSETSEQGKVFILECLKYTLKEYIDNEQDEVWLASFKSALETIEKIQSELLGGNGNV